MVLIRGIVYLLCSVLLCGSISAEPDLSSAPTALLNHLVGAWILRGTIAGKQTTHDVQAAWVLNKEYLQLHEISREKSASGGAAYEAIVYINWDVKARQYTCLWLDSTAGGGLSPEGIARANQAGDSIPFIFTLSASDEIHTTFSYDKAADTWQWLIDNVVNGRTQRFANVTLNRLR
jgi:hypothetical protein